MNSKKVPKFVTPVKAGVQNLLERLDSAKDCAVRLANLQYVPGFHRSDAKREFVAFYEFLKFGVYSI